MNDSANTGHELFFNGAQAGSSATVRGSVMDTGGVNECDDVNGSIVSDGYNIDRGMSCNLVDLVNGDDESANAMLGSLASNGGLTATREVVGLPALNHVPAIDCEDVDGNDVLDDQRGAPRNLGGANCDVGAYERAFCSVGGGPVLINLIGTDGNNGIVGTAGPDGILGLDGADTINGAAGSDAICAGNGDDTIIPTVDGVFDGADGEAGSDTVEFATLPTNPYTATVGASIGFAGGPGIGTDFLTSVESATGGAGDEAFIGDSGSNTLLGNDGADTLTPGAGDDVANGGNNPAAGDTVSYDGFSSAAVASAVTVDISNNSTSQNTGGGGTDSVFSFEHATGSAFNDTLIGTTGNNTLNGAAGVDTVNYSAGVGVVVDLSADTATNQGNDSLPQMENAIGSTLDPDAFTGGAEDNVFTGGASAGDVVSFGGVAQPVQASLAGGSATGQATTQDTFSGIENLFGSNQADTLTGDAGANNINGGDGGDSITGGLGIDTILAGGGADSLFLRDSLGDTADCGAADAATDTVLADLPAPTDTLTNCDMDTVLFGLPAVDTPPTTTPPPPTTTPVKCRKGFKLKKVRGKKKKKCVRKKKRKK